MALKQYDPRLQLITLGGVPITGFADGSFLKIEFNEDAYSLQIGADGEGVRSRSNNNSAKITVTLLQSSESNDLLSGLHALDRASPGLGLGAVPFLHKDASGRSLNMAERMWITKSPAQEFGREAGPREWVLETDNLIPFVAGN